MTPPYGLMADLHLHNWSSFSATAANGLNTRLAGLLGEIARCAEEVHKAGGSTIVMAGDIFHVRGSVAPSVLNPTRDWLRTVNAKYGTKFIIMPGNHDLEGKESTRVGSAVTALECDHVIVHNEVQYLPQAGAWLFPWFESTADLKAKLKEIADSVTDPGAVDAIIHAPIDGVIAGLPLHGLEPDYLAGLGFRRVFAGHYHNHKVFAGDKVVSIGALAHHTWSDVGSRAGFLIVAPDQVRWMKSHLPEFIDLTRLAEYEPDDVPMLVDGNFVRVRVDSAKSKEVEEARQELLAMGARAVLVQPEPKPPAEAVRAGHTVKSGESLEVSVSEFVNKQLPAVELRESVLKEALSVLGSVATI